MTKKEMQNTNFSKYKNLYNKIIDDPNLTRENKKILVSKLVDNMAKASKKADRRLAVNKFIQKVDLDKVAGFELLVAGIFPLMGASLITWGLGPNVDMDLYNKLIDVLMNPVLKVSAVAAFAGLGTTILQDSINKKNNQNVEKANANKMDVEAAKKEIEELVNAEEFNM